MCHVEHLLENSRGRVLPALPGARDHPSRPPKQDATSRVTEGRDPVGESPFPGGTLNVFASPRWRPGMPPGASRLGRADGPRSRAGLALDRALAGPGMRHTGTPEAGRESGTKRVRHPSSGSGVPDAGQERAQEPSRPASGQERRKPGAGHHLVETVRPRWTLHARAALAPATPGRRAPGRRRIDTRRAEIDARRAARPPKPRPSEKDRRKEQ